MAKNLGNTDRAVRVVAAIISATCAVAAPVSPLGRLVAFGGTSLYLLFTALAGTCLGYRLMGKSTCPVRPCA